MPSRIQCRQFNSICHSKQAPGVHSSVVRHKMEDAKKSHCLKAEGENLNYVFYKYLVIEAKD